MKPRYIFQLLLLCFSFFSFAKGEMINNPISSDKESNPVDYIIFLDSQSVTINPPDWEAIELDIIQDFTKFYDSYLINPPIMLGKDESDAYFSLVGNIFYRYTSSSVLDNLMVQGSSITLTSGIPYSNYISLKQDNTNDGTSRGSRSKIPQYNVVFYGKKDENIYFYYVIDSVDSQPKQYSISFGNINEKFLVN